MKIIKSFFQQSLTKEFENVAIQNDKQTMLGAILLIVFATGMIGGSVMFFYDMNSYLSLFLLGIVCIFGWILNRAGYSRISAVILIAALLIVIQFNIFAGFGIHDVAIVAWPAFIFFSGLLLGWQVIPYVTAIIIVLAVATKAFPNAQFFSDYSDTGDLIVMLLILLAFSIIAIALLRSSENLIHRLQQSEERYRQVSELVSDYAYSFRFDPNGQTVYEWVTEGFIRINGYTIEEVAERGGTLSLVHPEDLGLAREHVRALLNNKADTREFRIVNKNGTIHWLKNYACPVWDDETQRVIRIYGSTQDITERKLIEQALQDVPTIAIQGYTVDGTTSFWNTASEKLYGYSAQEAIGKNLLDLIIPAEMHSGVQQAMQQMAEDGKPIPSAELSLMRKDGSRVTVYSSHSVIPVPGRTSELFCLDIDLTERKQAELALLESEERYRALFEQASDGIFYLSADGKLLAVNNSFARMHGYSVEEMQGMLLQDLDTPKATQQAPERIRRIMAGEVIEFETEHYHKDGHIFPLAVSTGIISIHNQQLIQAFHRDITERKRAEELLRQSDERYKLMFESAPLAINITRGAEITYANPSYLKMFGFSSLDELKKIAPLDLFTPDWRPKILENIQRRAKGLEMPDQYEAECFRQDGTKFSVLMNFSRTTFVDGPATVGFILDITERKQAEDVIHQNERRLRDAQAIGRIGDWEIDMTTGELFYSRQMCELLERDPALGAPEFSKSLEYLEPEVAERMQKMIMHAMETGEGWDYDLPVLLPSGRETWHRNIGAVTKDSEGNVLKILGVAQDVTERKCAEEQISQSEKKYRELFHANKDGIAIFLLDPHGPPSMFVECNEAAPKMLGYTREEMLQLTPMMLELQTSQEQLQWRQSEFVSKGAASFETILQHKDGHSVFVEFSAQMIQYEGQPAIMNIVRDITERKQAEEALRLSEAHFSTVFHASPMPIAITRLRDNQFIDMNEAWQKVTGYSKSEALGLTPTDLNNWVDPNARARLIEILRKSGIVSDFEFQMRKKTGEINDMLLSAETVEIAGESCMLSLALDVTERKRAERLIHQYADELEVRVQERTAELVLANRAKDEFLANMSHELRTPLNGILGFSETLLESVHGSLNEKQRRAIEFVLSSGEHLLGLINDILDVSKIEAGHLELQPEDVPVNDICHSSLNFIKQLANKKSIKVEYSSSPAQSMIHADPKRLKQILVNLLSNAVKFTPEKGSVKLEVHADYKTGRIHFSVTDTGIGISPEDLQKLFKPFIQVDNSLSRQYEGTGLGLVLSKRMVEMHGGSIEVQSEAGLGSCFSFYLPWHQNRQDEKNPGFSTVESKKHDPTKAASNGKILLADDNEANVMMIQDYLEGYGYQVFTAHDGRGILSKIEECSPHIILMDIQMPHVDGYEATSRLRADPRFASVPVIALTAFAMPGDRERCLKAGMNEYLSKPVKLKELVLMIEGFLNRSLS
jgi:PAS domain S-box-containing protein